MADLRFDVSAETKAATAALGKFAQDVQKKLVNAVRSLPDIELTADSSDAQREMKRLRDELAALANKKVGVDIDAGAALVEMQRLQTELRALGSSTTEVGVRADVDQAARALGDVEAEVRRLNGADAEVEVTADTSAAESELSDFADTAKGVGAAAGASMGAALVFGIAANLEMGQVRANLSAQLGLSAEESQRVGAVAGRLYANAYGESLAEVGDAVAAVIQNVEGIANATDDELQAVTGQMISLSQVMQVDVGEAATAVGQLIRTGLAGNATEAMDLLVAATQEGANKYGDLADTVTSSSATLAQFGLDGKTAIGAITQAMEAGAPSADFFIGALEELAGNAGDSVEIFQSLGLNGEEMGRKLTGGGQGAREALTLLMGALRNVQDPTVRSTALVGLFGEEATAMQEALLAVDPSTAVTALGDVAGSAAEADAVLGDLAQNKITALTRGFEQWTASMVATEGPIGNVAAGIGVFGPMAITALTAVAPLVLALKMGGVAAALGGVSAAAAGTGTAAGAAAAGGASRLLGALKFVGVAGVIGGVALAIDGVNTSAANGADSLEGWSADLHEVANILRGDFESLQDPIGEIGSEWDQLVRDFETGTSDAGRMWGEFQREMSGFELTDINIDIDANAEGAKRVVDQLIGEVNGAAPEVNINGNDTGAAFALRRILEEIAGGAESVLINGEPMPAVEALDYVKGLITNSTGDVTINGETMPAGEALAMLMGEIASTQGKVLIGADYQEALGQLGTVQSQINSSIGTMTINGNRMPADQALGAVLAAIDSGAAEVDINGTAVPAGLALTNLLAQVDAGAGTVTINGNQVPAGQALAALIQTISASQGTSTINGQPSPAYAALSAFLTTGARSVTTPQVNANTANAYGQMNRFIASFQGRTIDLRVSTAGRLAAGAVIPAAATWYASGGVDRPMKRMPVGVPAVAQPGMLRVFGDRSDVNESYIPWKRSHRSVGLLDVTADALGFDIVPKAAAARYASGGVSLSDPGARTAAREIADRLRSSQQVYEDWSWRGSSDNVGRWNDVLLDAYRASGSGSATAWLTSVANGGLAASAGARAVSAARVASAVTGAPLSRAAAAGAVAVADAALRTEVAGLRRDIAQSNHGAATIGVLRSLLGAVQASGSSSALAEASDAARRSARGAW